MTIKKLNKSKKILRLPKSKNGNQRKTFSGGAYKYQKDILKARARSKGMTVSYYLNYLLWSDYL